MLRRRFTGLWRHADFIRVWIGQTICVFGSLIGGPALAFTAILILHATPFQLGLLAAARLAPGFLTGLVAGAWVDRLRRRPIMIGADIARAMLLATVPLAAVLGLLRIEQLYVVTFLVSVLTILFDVAYQSYLPSLIARADLVEGNSKLSASASVAEVSGFALAGWLVQLFTAPITILIDASQVRTTSRSGLPSFQSLRSSVIRRLRIMYGSLGEDCARRSIFPPVAID